MCERFKQIYLEVKLYRLAVSEGEIDKKERLRERRIEGDRIDTFVYSFHYESSELHSIRYFYNNILHKQDTSSIRRGAGSLNGHF